MELSCFFDDPVDVGNLISGSSAFSKTSLNTWKFTVHVVLKSGLENFEHHFTSVWDECNCAVVWAFFGIAFFGDWNENWLFQSCGHCSVFQICWHIECSTFTASSFRKFIFKKIAFYLKKKKVFFPLSILCSVKITLFSRQIKLRKWEKLWYVILPKWKFFHEIKWNETTCASSYFYFGETLYSYDTTALAFPILLQNKCALCTIYLVFHIALQGRTFS